MANVRVRGGGEPGRDLAVWVPFSPLSNEEPFGSKHIMVVPHDDDWVCCWPVGE